MLELNIQLDSRNASVATDQEARTEAIACLSRIILRINEGVTGGKLQDVNGNTIGSWYIDTGEGV